MNKSFNDIEDKIYLFLDEIEKLPDWENRVKIYYDLYPNIKFIITGSVSISLRKGSNESLAGRLFSYFLPPLTFGEYLELNNLKLDGIINNIDLYKNKIIPLFYKYIKYGTFPELLFNNDDEFAREYIFGTVIDRIIYKDISDEFHVNDTNLLKILLKTVIERPGMILNFKSLSENYGRDQRTISNYFEYLQFGLLTKIVYNYRPNEVISMRKLKKCYLSTPNLIFAMSANFDEKLPYILENLVLMHTNCNYFYKNNFEVDFILKKDSKIIPIEVKKSYKSIKQINNFLKHYSDKVMHSLMITLNDESISENIKIIPVYKFLLLEEYKYD